jgi:two-component system, OmpR family, response regulator
MKLLLIEDDVQTAAYIVRGFQEHGHTVDHAKSGRDGLFLAGSESYDVLIVDRMLPGVDGLSIVKTLRSTEIDTPVIFLTTMGGIEDRVIGLQSGADDYLVKPFAFSELVARVNALARRTPLSKTQTVLRVGDLELDLLKRKVRRGADIIDLQAREFALLEFLVQRAGQVVTRTMLLEGVWNLHFDPKTNIVETHMSRLRSRIDNGRSQALIHTVWRSGYMIRAEPEPA